MEVGGERHSEATQPPEKEPRYPSQRRLGGRLMPSLDRYGVGAAARNEWLYQLHYPRPQNPSSRRETFSSSQVLPKIQPVLMWDRTLISAVKGRQLRAKDEL